MNFTLECEQEVDGRWIVEVPELPGVLYYGDSAADAMSKAEILASLTAKCMGDSLAVHHSAYHHWLDQSDVAAVTAALAADGRQ